MYCSFLTFAVLLSKTKNLGLFLFYLKSSYSDLSFTVTAQFIYSVDPIHHTGSDRIHTVFGIYHTEY